jgi:ketosteroid isomerase-like protein
MNSGSDARRNLEEPPHVSDDVSVVRRLYEAMAARDPHEILATMNERFVGTVSDGMPLGVGGRHEGRTAMLRDVWGKIFASYDVRVEPERFLPCGKHEVVVLGHYRGSERASGRALDAAFAHVISVRDGRVDSLRQITDTRRWPSS